MQFRRNANDTTDTTVIENEANVAGAGAEAGAAGTEAGAEEATIEFNGQKYTKAQLDELLKSLDQQKKDIKAAAKGQKPAAAATPKGVMVSFKNKAGETITGYGTLYFVARYNKKLHYKEASNVSVLPADWKEGDEIPAVLGDKAKITL